MKSIKTVFTVVHDHHEYTLEFVRSHAMRFNCFGKCWPTVTQCIVWTDGQFRCSVEVVKHAKDTDNPEFARALVAKMAMKKARFWKKLRMEFWKQIGHPTPNVSEGEK